MQFMTFDTVRNNNIQMTLPSLEYYYQYKSELKDINVHLEFENLLHRSGFKILMKLKKYFIIMKMIMEVK